MDNLPVAVRLNPFKRPASELPILKGATRVPWCDEGYILVERPVFTLHPLFHAGCYYVQDSSAMYVGHLFRQCVKGRRGRLRVLDLCAAPGGKTTDLAASLRTICGDDFLLVSNEVMKQRVGVLDDNVARWGDPNVVVTSADPAAFAALPGFFDVIVADVPCSGEGMFRKDARAEKEWSPDTVKLCASRQRRILADVWPSLKKDGLLIYSTCTYERAENDDNLSWTAGELGGEIIPPVAEFEEYGVELTPAGHMLRAGKSLGEGQWAGALVKTSETGRETVDESRLAVLHPLRMGLKKGEMKGKVFVPDPDWALSIKFDRGSFPCYEVDKQTALHYLHRDALSLPDAPVGFVALTYRGIPIGFVKNIGTRCNNLHPQDRRILMDI
ncbi:MAG: rRNA cytosine-C5-methyltransferase [Bacteroidales bacterium]|nr:rRNA cytosine-C5-methyltransferase [Bacteroidales bacterium]